VIGKVREKAGDWCVSYKYYVDAMEYYSRCGRFDKIWEVILDG